MGLEVRLLNASVGNPVSLIVSNGALIMRIRAERYGELFLQPAIWQR